MDLLQSDKAVLAIAVPGMEPLRREAVRALPAALSCCAFLLFQQRPDEVAEDHPCWKPPGRRHAWFPANMSLTVSAAILQEGLHIVTCTESGSVCIYLTKSENWLPATFVSVDISAYCLSKHTSQERLHEHHLHPRTCADDQTGTTTCYEHQRQACLTISQ